MFETRFLLCQITDFSWKPFIVQSVGWKEVFLNLRLVNRIFCEENRFSHFRPFIEFILFPTCSEQLTPELCNASSIATIARQHPFNLRHKLTNNCHFQFPIFRRHQFSHKKKMQLHSPIRSGRKREHFLNGRRTSAE